MAQYYFEKVYWNRGRGGATLDRPIEEVILEKSQEQLEFVQGIPLEHQEPPAILLIFRK